MNWNIASRINRTEKGKNCDRSWGLFAWYSGIKFAKIKFTSLESDMSQILDFDMLISSHKESKGAEQSSEI